IDGRSNFLRFRTIVLRLISSAGTGFFYTTTRRRALPKLQLMKFDPVVNKHVLFVEGLRNLYLPLETRISHNWLTSFRKEINSEAPVNCPVHILGISNKRIIVDNFEGDRHLELFASACPVRFLVKNQRLGPYVRK
ncbi:hypothetical protein BC832DRAFT_528241, partial [Gaertneriomyces semiglobifer]